MTPQEQVELMKADLPYHLRNTVTMGTGQVTELRRAAADEIERLRGWLAAIGQLPDIDADNRTWMALGALRGEPVPGQVGQSEGD